MEDKEQLLQRIEKLEKEILALKQANSIPIEIYNAFGARGFLNVDNFIIAGQTEVGALGTTILYLPGLNKYSMAIAFYANMPDTGVVDAYIESDGNNGYQLHIEGIATKRINYIVFLNNNMKLNISS